MDIQNTAVIGAQAREQMVKEKIQILHQLHTYCQKNEIAYFAVSIIAQAAEMERLLTEEEELSPWEAAMPRADFERFRQNASHQGFLLTDTLRGTFELRRAGIAVQDAFVLLCVYDALPADLTRNCAFVEEMNQKNQEYLEILEQYPQQAEDKYAALCAFAQQYADDETAVMTAPLICQQGQQMNRALLYPLKNRRFYDILIQVPFDCSVWTAQGSLTLAKQKLHILRELDAFCKQNQLPYFAISKLEISSRMYGNLMPDFGKSAMELGMLRCDYERLQTLLCTKRHTFVIYSDSKDGVKDGALRMTLKTFIKSNKRPGAVLSVIPYDFLPQEEAERKAFLLHMKELNRTYAQAAKSNLSEKEALYEQIQAEAQRYDNYDTKQIRQISRVQCGQSKILFYHEVYPVVRTKIADFEINSPCNPYIWAANENIDFNEAANKRKTEILKRLNRLCEDHQITTFAVAGLLIGVVTYQDYIPNKPLANWDLAALRNDYDKLVSVLRDKAEQYGLTFNEFRDSEHHCPKATKTVDLKEFSFPKGEIRLLPFDKMPEAYDTQYAFLRKLRRLNTAFKEMSNYIIQGSCNLGNHEIKKIQAHYGDNPLCALYEKINDLAQTYNEDSDTHLYGRMALEKSKFIPENELFPLEKAPFRDTKLNRPRDYSVWTPVIDESLHHQVKSIQQADLLLIDKIDEICRKLDIGYFICGGSMLGYMRHGGFIPWDDDIDVAMLRKDYDRFIQEAKPFLDDRFFLQTRHDDPNIPYLFSKLRLNNTEYITKYNEHRSFHKGICLDIFPFDFIPNDPKEQEAFKEEVLKLSAAHNRVVNNQMPDPIDPIQPRNLKERYYHWYGMAKRFFFRCHSLNKTQQAYLDKATQYNSRAEELGLTTVASFVPSYTYIKLEDLLPYQDVLFEGHRVKVPKRPDVFLKMQYGDYLQLPPKHNQVAHRLVRWSVDVKADREHVLAAANKES